MFLHRALLWEGIGLAVPPNLHAQATGEPDHPLMLSGLVARSLPPIECPARDEAEARALWVAASSRYSHATDTIEIQSNFTGFRGEMSHSDLVNAARTQPSISGRRKSGAYPRRVGAESGYGARLLRIDFDPSFAGWRYIQLESHDVQHFIDESFGRFNRMELLAREPERIVVGFCSRDLPATAVGLEGMLILAPDTTLIAARWRYRTPKPNEEAGGDVTFVPWEEGEGLPWLVPEEGFYWRKLVGRKDRYFARWEHYDHWKSVLLSR